jgi:hypothetical protein
MTDMGGLLEEIEQLTERINALGKRKEVTNVANKRYDIHGRDLDRLAEIQRGLTKEGMSKEMLNGVSASALSEYDRQNVPLYTDMKLEDYANLPRWKK